MNHFGTLSRKHTAAPTSPEAVRTRRGDPLCCDSPASCAAQRRACASPATASVTAVFGAPWWPEPYSFPTRNRRQPPRRVRRGAARHDRWAAQLVRTSAPVGRGSGPRRWGRTDALARGIVCGGQHTAGGDRTPPKYRRRQVTRRGTNIAEEITSLVSAENRPYIHMLNGLLVSARPPAVHTCRAAAWCVRPPRRAALPAPQQMRQRSVLTYARRQARR